MTRIVLVHGISNQYRGEMELRNAWFPALCDGLARAGHSVFPAAEECYCPFYGDLFRSPGHLGAAAAVDLEGITSAECELLERVWRSAVDADGDVPAYEAFGDTLARFPRFAERALTALARSPFLANLVPLKFLGDLRQVHAYLNDDAIHQRILSLVTTSITSETRVLIGHSLGSVIAYEAVCAKPSNVTTLLTLGSPLGIPNVVFHKLTPLPAASGKGVWPQNVRHWTNIAASGDIVAAEKALAPLFEGAVRDCRIESGWDAHSSTRYLNNGFAGEAIWKGLQS